jgi:hypothetical protein
MPTSEVVALQEQVDVLARRIHHLDKKIDAAEDRIAQLENALAGGIAAGGGLSELSVSAGIRAKLAQAGLHTIEDVKSCNENKLMKVAGLRRTDARRVRKALKALD